MSLRRMLAATAVGVVFAGVPANWAAAAEVDPGTPYGDTVSVTRADGRVDQLESFTSSAGMFVWHRGQAAVGGDYGPWEQVSTVAIAGKPVEYHLFAGLDTDGRLEVFFSTYNVVQHVTQAAPEGRWAKTESFGLSPLPYFGFATLFTERDGRLIVFAPDGSTPHYREQNGPSGQWGPSTPLPPAPASVHTSLAGPITVDQLPDGRLHVVTKQWSLPGSYYQISQLSAGGQWGEWQVLNGY